MAAVHRCLIHTQANPLRLPWLVCAIASVRHMQVLKCCLIQTKNGIEMLSWVVCRKAVMQEDSGVPSPSAPEPIEIGATYRSLPSSHSLARSLTRSLTHPLIHSSNHLCLPLARSLTHSSEATSLNLQSVFAGMWRW